MLPIPMHDYQTDCKLFIETHPYCGLFLDMGLGKTLITLMALYELGVNGYMSGHILVIAPKTIARSTWLDEIEKWQIPVRTISLVVNKDDEDLKRKERLALYDDIPNQPPTMYFISRDLIKDLINNTPTWYFPTVVIDEAQGFKSYKSQRFKTLQKVRPYISRLIELSGTPVPNGLMDLWSQIWLLDMGARLGPNITTYRKTWFRETRWCNNYPIDWEPLYGADADIHNRISDITISMKNKLKLPPVTYNNIYVHMTKSERTKYNQLIKSKILQTQDENGDPYKIIARNPAILQAKLAQMASGTAYLDDNSTPPPDKSQTVFTPGHVSVQKQAKSIPALNADGSRKYEIIHRHKIEYVEHIVDNTDSPVLVLYHFTSDKTEIVSHFENLEKQTKDPRYHIEVFDGSSNMKTRWNNREIGIMLLQPASAGYGLNLQYGGHTIIWYTLSWSLEEYLQANARIYRQGQTEPIIIHQLLTKDTVDEGILLTLEQKDSVENALLKAVELKV